MLLEYYFEFLKRLVFGADQSQGRLGGMNNDIPKRCCRFRIGLERILLQTGEARSQFPWRGIPVLAGELQKGLPSQLGGFLRRWEKLQEMQGNLGIQVAEQHGGRREATQQNVPQAVGLANDIAGEMADMPDLDLRTAEDGAAGRPGLQTLALGSHQIRNDLRIPRIGFGSAVGACHAFGLDPVGRGHPNMGEPIRPEKIDQEGI